MKQKSNTSAATLDKRSFDVVMRAEGEGRTVTGVAAVFNQWADIGWFREMIEPSAFDEALQRGDDVRALLNHDNNQLLARTKSGTLTLRKGDSGLEFSFEMPESRNDVLESIRRGDLSDCSFQFSMRDGVEEWRYNSEDDQDERVIKRIGKLYDIALVTFPAYEGTSIDLRSYEAWVEKRTADHQEDQPTEQEDNDSLYDGRAIRERSLTILLHTQKALENEAT